MQTTPCTVHAFVFLVAIATHASAQSGSTIDGKTKAGDWALARYNLFSAERIPAPDWLTRPTGTASESTETLIVRGQNAGLPIPNVRDPGTDFSDYPNSAKVVPVGVFYWTSEWNYMTTRAPRIAENSVPYTFRTGVVENLEFRVVGSGVTRQEGPDFNETGFSPVGFGVKWHLFDGRDELYLPAVGLESDVSTRLSSTRVTTFRMSHSTSTSPYRAIGR